jgi:hypothetical protein
MNKKTSALVLSAATMAGTVAVLATPAFAACTLGAQTPTKPTGLIQGTGTRGTTCGANATVTVSVRQQRTLQPDDVIASNSAVGGANRTLTAVSNKTSGKVRTRTSSSTGAQTETAWVNL